MRKIIAISLAVLMVAFLVAGCRSTTFYAANSPEGGSPANETPVVDVLEPQITTENTNPETEPFETEGPVKMTMEEIEAILGYGYKLPDESEYNGTIVSMLDKPEGQEGYIALSYCSDDFPGGEVFITKAPAREGLNEAERWPELSDAGTETVKGIKIQFLGYMPEHRLVAYWDQNGYHYVINCAACALNAELMSFYTLFVETE